MHPNNQNQSAVARRVVVNLCCGVRAHQSSYPPYPLRARPGRIIRGWGLMGNSLRRMRQALPHVDRLSLRSASEKSAHPYSYGLQGASRLLGKGVSQAIGCGCRTSHTRGVIIALICKSQLVNLSQMSIFEHFARDLTKMAIRRNISAPIGL